MSQYHPGKSRTALIALLLLMAGLLIAGCVSLSPQGPGHNVSLAPTTTPPQVSTPGGIANGTLEVHFIDVGQGDSILVKYGNKSMLVDGGPIDAGPTVASYLKSHGVSTIDVLVSTHPHADHIGGLLTILEQFPVKVVYDNGIPHTTQTYEEYLTLIDQKNIRYIVPQRGDTLDLGRGVAVLVLSPPPGGIDGEDLNENSHRPEDHLRRHELPPGERRRLSGRGCHAVVRRRPPERRAQGRPPREQIFLRQSLPAGGGP